MYFSATKEVKILTALLGQQIVQLLASLNKNYKLYSIFLSPKLLVLNVTVQDNIGANIVERYSLRRKNTCVRIRNKL